MPPPPPKKKEKKRENIPEYFKSFLPNTNFFFNPSPKVVVSLYSMMQGNDKTERNHKKNKDDV